MRGKKAIQEEINDKIDDLSLKVENLQTMLGIYWVIMFIWFVIGICTIVYD